MNVLFTGDTHFRHTNIIKYCGRPFKDSDEMDETIIRNWNSVTGPNDLVYHLGDYCFGDEDSIFDKYFNRLNGDIILIKGNHDKLAWRNRKKFWGYSDSYREIEVSGQAITLCHYAMKVWNKSHHGAWHLYGHSHGTLPDDPHSLSIDVGVDCHNFTPITFEQVKKIMAKKLFKPLDHHGKREETGGIGLSREEYQKADRKRLYEQLKVEFS